MDKLKPCEVGQVKFDAQGNREGTIIGSGHWPELVKESGFTDRWLRLELAPVGNLDGADWSLLEETQDSLREHMAELHRKDAELTAANTRIAELKRVNAIMDEELRTKSQVLFNLEQDNEHLLEVNAQLQKKTGDIEQCLRDCLKALRMASRSRSPAARRAAALLETE